MDCIKNNIEITKRQNNFICTFKMAYNNTCNSINTGYFRLFVSFKKESKIIKYTYTKQHKHSNPVPVLLFNYYFLYKVIYNPTILFIPTNPNSDNGLMYGGLASAITGGDFAQGAAIGLVVTALNHALHEALDPDPTQQQKGNEKLTEEQINEIRLKIAEVAEKYFNDKSIQKWYSNEEPNQCNQFAQDIPNEVQKGIFPTNPDRPDYKYYNAKDIANANTQIIGWKTSNGSDLMNYNAGDIVGMKINDSYHSSIVVKFGGKLNLIYAGNGSQFLSKTPVSYFIKNSLQITIRRYVGN